MKQFNRKLRSAQLDEDKQKKRKKALLPAVFLLAAAAAAILLMFWSRRREKAYNDYEIVHSEELSAGSSARYAAYEEGYIVYDRDGARAYTADGKQLWNAAYNLKNPIIAVCEPYAAVADKGNGQFYIIDGKGNISSFSVAGKLAGIKVAAQGVTAVLATEDDRDHIYLYEPGSSTSLVDIMEMTKSNGFPVTMALSQDGRKLVTSYLSMESGKLQSWVTFYNFGEVGQNHVDNMVGSYSFEAIVPEVAFITNDTVLVGKDDGIVLYQMTEIPKVLMTEPFDRPIHSIFYSSSRVGVVLKGEAGAKEQLLLYRVDKAKRILDIPLEYDYSGIYTAGEDIVLYGGQELTVLRQNGALKFHMSFSKNVRQVLRVDDREKYIMIGDAQADTIRLKRQK
ncbi:MAG: hypothetical protein K2N94_11585 [Lachnospiraceae bacterium]|nr:hypothetical protein [Lachnospiraceae bacterium]